MPRAPFSRLVPLLAASAATAGLVACGGNDGPTATVSGVGHTAAERAPAASPVSDLLGRLADVPASHNRLAYVNEAALSELELGFGTDELRTAVLGASGAARATADDGTRAAAQLGAVTVLVGADGVREVVGASGALADQLASTTPQTSVLAPETASALQSCLGDPAAEVIRGSDVLGPTSGIGVSLLDSQDPPAGPKLHLCAAPHYVRDLHAIEQRLKARFPKADVSEDEIGEREIVGAVVAVDDLDPAELRALLGGGSALLGLARG